MANPTKSKCLIVLGMHRSGTSALSGALTIAGLNPGKQLFDPEEDNPKGNFENARITKINEKILAELFARWNDTLLIPDNWWSFKLFEDYFKQVRKIIQEEIDDGQSILVKDPRLSVLLPLYLDVLKDLGLQPSFVICIRNPYEIAASLKKRNHLSQEKSLLLWMDYQVKAEYFSRNFPRIFVSYFEFLKDPLKILGKIKETLHPDIELDSATEKKVMAFLDQGLKHHNLEDELPDTVYLPQIKELFYLLKGASLRDLSPMESDAAEKIRVHFSGLIKFFSGLSQNPEAVLTVHYDDQTRTAQRIPVRYGNNKLEFAINPGIPVTKILFHPLNSWVGIRVQKIEAIDPGQGSFSIEKYSTNSGLHSYGDMLVFETEMPELIIELPSARTISQIIFNIDYLAIGRITYRMASDHFAGTLEHLEAKLQQETEQLVIQKRDFLRLQDRVENLENETIKLNNIIQEKERNLDQKNNELNDRKLTINQKDLEIKENEKQLNILNWQLEHINNSLSWKVGSIATAPARFIFKIFKTSK